MMSDSGSDIEIIAEVDIPSTSRSRRKSKRLIDSDSDEEFQLPDLDDDDSDSDPPVIRTRDKRKRSHSSANSSKVPEVLDLLDDDEWAPLEIGIGTKEKRKRKVSEETKKNIPDIVLSDHDDMESVTTEVIRDDDLDSLPSISSPSPVPAAQDDFGYDEDGLGDMYLGSSSSASSSKKPEVIDIDDFDNLCVESQFTLADVLAGSSTKNKRKSDKRKSTREERETVIPKTSTSSFKPKDSTTSSKPSSIKAKTTNHHEDKEASPVSYQMNIKSSKQRSKPKRVESNPVKPTTLAATSTSKASTKFSGYSSAGTSSASSSQSQPGSESLGIQKHKPPKDVMKSMVLQISENILSDAIIGKLIEKEVKFNMVENAAIPNSISFEHNVPFKLIGKDNQVREQVHKEIDENVIILFQLEDNLELLQAEINRDDPSYEENVSTSLTDWVNKILKKHPKNKLTLLISGLDPYLRKMHRAAQKEYRDKVLQGGSGETKKKKKQNAKQTITLSRYEVLNAFISMQLETHVDYRFYDNNSDLELLLLQYTKSIAEAPYKKEKLKSTEFDWYAVADAVGGIPVEENGKGMRSLWLAQLEQFPKVGSESAIAIARAYGSPKSLYQAYRNCSSIQEGKEMLLNVQVTMGVGPLAKTRRLGPEASKRIYRFFTSTDGERELDS